MARLAGPTLAELSSTYNESSFSGFGNGVAAKPAFIADVAGTIENVIVGINDMGGDANIRLQLYKQPGGTGLFQLVGTANVTTAGSPQTRPLTISGDASCAVGDAFFLVMLGDVSRADGGAFFRAAYDQGQTQSATVGQTSFAGSVYDTPPATIDYSLYSTIADGVYWFQVDGTAGATTDLEVSETFRDAAGALVADQNFEVTIFTSDGAWTEIIATATVASVSGVITVNTQSLPAAGAVVWMAIRAESEADATVAATVVPVTVVDLNA